MADRVSGVPTPRQQKFILTELIPAILREGGAFFAMETWRETAKELREEFGYGSVELDGVVHFDVLPKRCESVQCIGGTAEALLFKKPLPTSDSNIERDERIACKLGLTYREAQGLFYKWTDSDEPYQWPSDSRNAYEEASTSLEKAQVVAALLTRIATEGGRCLHAQYQ